MTERHIMVTATRHGLTSHQQRKLQKLLALQHAESTRHGISLVFHHGGCVGGDTEAHWMAKRIGIKTVVHPSNVEAAQGDIGPAGDHELRAPKPPLERNRDMAGETELAFACPRGMRETLRSGTWATVRYNHKKANRIIIVWPNGDTETYNEYLRRTK